MSFKQSVNAGLRRITGYSLTREDAASRARARAAAIAAAERRVRRQDRIKRQKSTPRQTPSRRSGGPSLPRYFDAEKRRIIEHVLDRTMTTPHKLDALIEATRYVAAHRIEGDIVECGVWRGGSMQAIALTLVSMGDTSRVLHLFDTFEGMPPPSAEDARTREGVVTSAAELLATSDRESRMWAIASLDDVRAGMEETGYPSELISYHPGLVESTTPDQAPGRIAILRLDTDWYSSTKHELEHLYPRLSSGGVLVVDDYYAWDGAKKAVDEWLARTNERLFMVPMGPGLIAVKG